MGGTWDATNLVAGDVAVIMPDRRSTTPSSAPRSPRSRGEKAGIIKAGKVAVVREQDARGARRDRGKSRRGRS